MITTGDFKGRHPKIIEQPPVKPPPPMVELMLTMEEARLVREACYLYWLVGVSSETRDIKKDWSNPTDLPAVHAAELAESLYNNYFNKLGI